MGPKDIIKRITRPDLLFTTASKRAIAYLYVRNISFARSKQCIGYWVVVRIADDGPIKAPFCRHVVFLLIMLNRFFLAQYDDVLEMYYFISSKRLVKIAAQT